jgi:hypothetical protein
MSGDPQQGAPSTTKSAPPATSSVPVIHRVCVQCNNVFRVPADKFDAKQCPKCHKG